MNDRLKLAVERVSTKTFVVFPESETVKTYEQFYSDVLSFAKGLVHLNLSKGDRIAICSPNNYMWVVTQFASSLLGLILVAINPGYRETELRYALKKVGVSCLVAPIKFKSTNYYKMMTAIFPEMNHLPKGVGLIKSKEFPEFKNFIAISEENANLNGCWNSNDILEMGSKDDENKAIEMSKLVRSDDLANIQYTSGTTGQPKGVVSAHHSIVNNANLCRHEWGLKESETIMCMPCPLFHALGCVLGSLLTVVNQSTIVYPSTIFSANQSLQAVCNEKCDFIMGTPTMYVDFLKKQSEKGYNLKSLKGGLIAGAPVAAPLIEKLINEMNMKGIIVSYGMTEMNLTLNSDISVCPEERIKSTGKVLPHMECAIFDDNKHMVPLNQVGHLCFRGISVMREYWDDQEKTNKDYSSDRWFHTGDLAKMNSDGSVTISGREKDMIIRGGENIYPSEVEQFIMKIDGIVEVQVVGVPDERLGEQVCAWINVKEDKKELITVEYIKEYLKNKITYFKIPKYILFKADFPRTASGKIQKFRIQEETILELELNKHLK
uniref:AMP-binding domain-containing protein n=1 Tax=Rhabditophanes sp. KR3021 TaxID=114890 RepID=A0AC35UDH6_9BILA